MFFDNKEPEPIDRTVMSLVRARVGRLHAIERDTLREEVNLALDRYEQDSNGKVDLVSDRQMRLSIARLRETPEGSLIMSSGGWAGYWMAKSFDEVEEHYAYERGRSLSLMSRIRIQRDLARHQFQVEPQMELFNGRIGIHTS